MASVEVLCPHCNRKQKVPEHRLSEPVVCLVCQQMIDEPFMHKIAPENQELAIKLKGRLVNEWGTTKLDEVKSKADDYTGRFEPVEDDDETGDDTGTGTGTGRGPMFESGMYSSVPTRRSGLSTAARTYIIGLSLLALLACGVVAVGLVMLGQDEQGMSEIDAAGGEGERIDRYPSGAVKTRWNVTLVSGIEQEHGPWLEWYSGGQQKTVGNYQSGEKQGTWTGWHENGQKSYEVTFIEGKQHGPWLAWHANGRKAGEGAYDHGDKIGDWRTWHADGRPASFERYDAGRPVGEWITWHPNSERKSHGR
jgi:antitoxin component YwqK of YwqJK toxin-antitoxin module